MQPPLWRIAALLLGSGACALVYQVVWQREFRLIFGASTAASAAVLATFVAGLGAGALWLGPRADRSPSPLRLYARLEAAIALSAALTPFLLDAARTLYLAAGGTPALGTFGGTLARLVAAALVLLVPTFLMGGTLPAAARAATSAADVRRSHLALLYGLNTLGAVLGSALATFMLLEWLGTRATLWSACLLNLAIASVAWLVPVPAAADEAGAGPTALDDGGPAVAPRRFVLAAAAVVGAVFFLMEIVWYRMLGPLLGGTVFSFGLVLALALFGVGVGGYLYSQLGAQRPATLERFATSAAMEATGLAIAFALGDRIALWTLTTRGSTALGFEASLLQWGLVAGVVVLPAAIAAGWQFPLLVALLGRGRRALGQDVGHAYAWNTAGAVAGSLLGGFGLLPVLGAPGTWRLAALTLLALAAAAALLGRGRGSSLRPAAAVGVVAVGLLAADGPGPGWRHSGVGAGRATALPADGPNGVEGWLREQRAALAWEREGLESSVALVRRQGLAFVINGKIDGHATLDAPTQVMAALLPVLIEPRVPRVSFVIGLGTGSSAGWLGSVPGVERVDVAELEPAILDVARVLAPVNQAVLDNPRVRVQIGDARELLLASRESYDLIFSEPSNPYRAGIASLFTREFYRAAAQRLAAGGVFVQWLQAYEVDADTVRSAYATLATEFAEVETWRTHRDLLLVARQQPAPPVDRARLEAALATEPTRSALLHAWRATDVESVLARFVAGPRTAREIAARSIDLVNTDDRNVVEFRFARNVGRDGLFRPEELLALARSIGDDQPRLAAPGFDPARFEEMRAALYPRSAWPATLPADARQRLLALEYGFADPQAALAAWSGQPALPRAWLEKLAVATGLAEAGRLADLAPMVAELRRASPSDAALLEAIAIARHADPALATAALAAGWAQLRLSPWAYPALGQRALHATLALARRAPTRTAE
ncbi:MAG: fused MFS/spermidine synthase, partial [Vicinamibacteria bacterium]|nr:fused MFS/spermidine synthase [Vicinamibacteria bacterium]